MTQLIRSVDVRAVDTETRTITGLAVPYGQTIDVPAEGIRERFERGAFGDVADVKLYWMHEHLFDRTSTPIGVVTKGEDTDEGYLVRARISDTPKGNEVYTLLKDGVLNKFSIGFEPMEDRDEDGVTVRTKVQLNEVSVVVKPAYNGAVISEVRTEENPNNKEDIDMSEEIKEVLSRVANLESANEELERRLAVAGEAEVKEVTPQFRTAGEFVQALAKGDTDAQEVLTRAYTGSTLANSHTSNDWKTGLLQIVTQNRNVINLFNKGPLGSNGNNVEYAKVSAVTGDVAQQLLEGDDLAYLQVGVTTALAPVKTYGAYSQLTRQAIERSDVPYLNLVLEAQAQSYAKVSNAAARTAMVAATPQAGTALVLATAKGAAWIGAVLDGVQKIDQNGLGASAEFIMVSKDVYLQVATLADTTDRPLSDINGDGFNTLGTVRGLVGTLAGLPVVVDYGLAAKSMYIAGSSALTTWESAGIPFRLDTENPINLSHVYSVYGYMAVGVTNALALVKPAIT